MVGERDLQGKLGLEEVKIRMIDYVGGAESSDVRRLAFFDNYDQHTLYKKWREVRTEVAGLHDPDEAEKKLYKESSLRVTEYEATILNREIEKNKRVPGYVEEAKILEGYFGELSQATYNDLLERKQGTSEEELLQISENLYYFHLREVRDAIAK